MLISRTRIKGLKRRKEQILFYVKNVRENIAVESTVREKSMESRKKPVARKYKDRK